MLKRLITELLLTLLFNSLIAIFINLLMANNSLKISFIYSQSIGLSIFCAAYCLTFIRRLHQADMFSLVTSIPLGGIIGIAIANQLLDIDLQQIVTNDPNLLLILLACTVAFGTIVSYYHYAQNVIMENSIAIREANLQQLANEKQLMEAHLKLLQAQIEPHFLFNTLSNVLSLIDEEPKRASMMLENFTKYLRVSLQRTRQEQTTLEDELDLLRNYLDIHTIRMGERLKYHIEVPKVFHNISLPPLLLQPLVENAIKHGLAPSLEGGTIHISATAESNILNITIVDTGIGLQEEHGTGMGLNNIRARMRALYGKQAKMTILQNIPCGVHVNLSLPLAIKI